MKFAAVSHIRQVLLKDSPDLENEIFTTRQFPLHEINVYVQVFVVEFLDDFLADHRTELLEIRHKAGIRIGHPLDGNNQVEIVTMPVLVCTWPKYRLILFFCPGRIVELMSGVKMFFS